MIEVICDLSHSKSRHDIDEALCTLKDLMFLYYVINGRTCVKHLAGGQGAGGDLKELGQIVAANHHVVLICVHCQMVEFYFSSDSGR